MSTFSTRCSKVAVPSGWTSRTRQALVEAVVVSAVCVRAGDRGADLAAVDDVPAQRLARLELVAEGVLLGGGHARPSAQTRSAQDQQAVHRQANAARHTRFLSSEMYA